MSTALTQYESMGAELTQYRPPETVLAEAKQAADALTRVISLKKNPVKFNGEIYLEFEDWQTCAKFYGVTARVDETKYVDYGGVHGFEAIAVALDRNGSIISRAESLCLNDEENWGMVPKYEWRDVLDEGGKKIWVEGKDGKKRPKAERVQVGETAKPLFQLKSMAQTRACSKVLRQVFAWIVVLAGYRPTPAEEMTGNEQFEDRHESYKEPVKQPTRTSDKKEPVKAAQQTQAAQPAQAAGTTDQPTGDEVSGIIKKAIVGSNGIANLTVGEATVIVPADKYDTDMVMGKFIKLRGSKRHSDKVGDYWILDGVRELSDVQESEPQKMDPENAALAAELFPDDKPAAGKEAVQGMIDNGQLAPASSLPSATRKPGTIGKKRQIRLDSLCNANKEKNNGFNHEEIKKILSALPKPVEHVQDMEESMYQQFEKWANGEEDWREFWKEDGID
jgi:hypothetical protein